MAPGPGHLVLPQGVRVGRVVPLPGHRKDGELQSVESGIHSRRCVMRNLHLSLLQELARLETRQDLEEAIAEVQRRIDLLEEVPPGKLPAVETDHRVACQYGFLTAKEFHKVNPFEGRILWSRPK